MSETASRLERGMASIGEGDWDSALMLLREAVASEPSAEAHEMLSWCAWSLHEAAELFAARENALRLYREAGDVLGAARMAMWIGADYVDFRGDLAVSNGWRQRARRMLEDQPLAPEHGWMHLIDGDIAMLVEDDPDRALEMALQVIPIGRKLQVVDLEVMGIALQGFALVSKGDFDAGMRLLDEAAALALSGEMTDPSYIAWALCYVIYACERIRDYDRAVQWCDMLVEHADRSGIASIRAICRVHLAGVLIWRGSWQEAERELSDAAKNLVPHRPLLAADGTVRLAEIRHRQGRVNEAEALFREVEWHPLAILGLAEITLEAGRPRDAAELIERFLRQVPESSRTQRVAAYELQVRAQALLGNHGAAASAQEAVTAMSEVAATLPLRAASCFSAGAIAAANGDYKQARESYEDAVSLYERSGAPYESARARLELASILVMLDRLDRARDEASAAGQTFSTLGSAFYATRTASLLQDIARRLKDAGTPTTVSALLTDRQVEILRLISQGMNDREIAAALVVSEHTVHRHVANILQRLNLPSRAAAVGYASSHDLISR